MNIASPHNSQYCQEISQPMVLDVIKSFNYRNFSVSQTSSKESAAGGGQMGQQHIAPMMALNYNT